MHPGFILGMHLHPLHPLAMGLIVEPVAIDLIALAYLAKQCKCVTQEDAELNHPGS